MTSVGGFPEWGAARQGWPSFPQAPASRPQIPRQIVRGPGGSFRRHATGQVRTPPAGEQLHPCTTLGAFPK